MSDTNSRGSKASRTECLHSAEEYFVCMQQNSLNVRKCEATINKFVDSCPASWFPYFVGRNMYGKKVEKEVVKKAVEEAEEVLRTRKD